MINITNNIYCVEVPTDAHGVKIGAQSGDLMYHTTDGVLHISPIVGTYQFLFLSKDVTGADWAKHGVPESVYGKLQGNHAVLELLNNKK